MKSLRVALCQIAVGTDKAANVASAAAAVARAAAQRGPEQPMLVVLGECWNSPYGTRFFPEYAEAVPEGPTTLAMRGWAREHGVWLVGGSIPERAPSGAAEALYNTCVVCDPAGSVVATHRKLHLFDVDVPGGIRFQESETLSPGAHVTTFDIHDAAANTFTVGVGICYDIRFAELAMLMARHHGARLLVYPSAFNMTTGPLHWDLLTRARAVDNQVFCAMVSPARDATASYVAYGHSLVVDPWGRVLERLEETPDVRIVDLDLGLVDQFRTAVPIGTQRRTDLYDVVRKT